MRCRNKAEHLGIRFYPYPLVYAIGGHAQDSAALNSFWLLDAFAQICPQSFFFKTQNNKAVLSWTNFSAASCTAVLDIQDGVDHLSATEALLFSDGP